MRPASSVRFWPAACLLVVLAGPLSAAETAPQSTSAADGKPLWSREDKALALNLGIVGGVTAYGFAKWDWGEASFSSSSEGWFGKNTAYGGADKLGHAYTGTVATALASELYRQWGYGEVQATRLGAMSSLLLTTSVELGDGFSPKHGFSWEDQVANLAGVGLEYLRQRHPAWRERVQFRWEYFPSPAVRHGQHSDLATDYSGSRWMLAFPLRAWGVRNSALGYLDLLVGYGTRGYSDDDRKYFDSPRRHPFIGIGIDLPRLFARLGAAPGTQRVFEYLQIPGSALPLPPRD